MKRMLDASEQAAETSGRRGEGTPVLLVVPGGERHSRLEVEIERRVLADGKLGQRRARCQRLSAQGPWPVTRSTRSRVMYPAGGSGIGGKVTPGSTYV